MECGNIETSIAQEDSHVAMSHLSMYRGPPFMGVTTDLSGNCRLNTLQKTFLGSAPAGWLGWQTGS